MTDALIESSFNFATTDGQRLHVYSWLPDGQPKAVMQIAHGMAEHAARYGELAAHLVDRGFAVYAHDHRGHGRTVDEGQEHGHFADQDGWGKLVDDVHCLNRHIAAEHQGLPIVLFGHSMGSFMVQQLLFEHPEDVDAAVLSASNGRPPPIAHLGRAIARIERLRLGKQGKSKLINAMSFGDFNRKFAPNRTDFDWLSRDQAAVDKYVADPWCGFMCSTQSWVDLLDALTSLTAPENLARVPKELPIYLFAGDQDAVGDMGRGVRRLADAYRSAWLRHVTIKLYPEGRHEMLNGLDKKQVTSDLLDWLDGWFTALSNRD